MKAQPELEELMLHFDMSFPWSLNINTLSITEFNTKIKNTFKCKLVCDYHYAFADDILKYTSMQYSSRKPLASIKCYDSVSDIIS